MRPASLVLVTVLLGFGCASQARPAPAPPALAPVIPALTVRTAAPEHFADPQRRRTIAARLPAVREVVTTILAADRLIGVAVGLVVDGELVLAEGFGTRHAIAAPRS